MHAYIIFGSQKEALEKAEEIAKQKKAKIIPNPIQKITDVRELLSFTKLSLREKTALLMEEFSEASIEAQNALLKLLEEPQEKLIFILTSINDSKILPTIISRCEVVRLANHKKATDRQIDLFNKFNKSSVADRLLQVSKITNRDDAIRFVNDLIIGGHANLVDNQIDTKILDEAQKTLTRLKANGNVNLQLASFVIKLS